MTGLHVNPATGLYFHRGGMLVALAVGAALTVVFLPVIGIYTGRRLRRLAEQDMTLMARGHMEPSGYALAHGAATAARIVEVVSWGITAFLLALAVIFGFGLH